ncbi:MAG: hypothetical protein A2481_01080 [Candidatus Yonathbacteria bacterium RIFOXYC2_FULL_47_9]|nr:MAG: hypothetical protein A2481_01080 [Candidatus Yonathbacteria bacterium RIFOXYC2_FULL_47_9]HAT68734.1 hypothetical protein [Candidatus Yonathbacteria bacterium]
MDISLAQGLPFAMLQPGMPLRIEVKNAIYVESLNLRNYHTVLARLELGMKISWILDGYWGKDEHGYIRRFAPLSDGQKLVQGDTPIDVSIDLREMKFDEVCNLHQMLVDFRRSPRQYVLL